MVDRKDSLRRLSRRDFLSSAALGALSLSKLPSMIVTEEGGGGGERFRIADRFMLPLNRGEISGFQYLQEAPTIYGGTYTHAGVDLNVYPEDRENSTGWEDFGLPVLNTAHGTCVYARDSESEFGNVVIMEHTILLENGRATKVYSLYAHLDQILAEEGKFYRIEQRIGTVGTTGGDYSPHLHWEIFGRAYYNYIQDWGFSRTAFDRGYVEATHYNPIDFMNFRNSPVN